MRTIKFRAYINKDHWIAQKYGDRKDWYVVNDWQDSIHIDSVTFQPNEEECINIVQYTGMKDQNGCEIYEGDIIDLSVGRYDVVEFRDCCFMLRYRDCNLSCTETMPMVIGNIYENKDLLDAEN